MLNRTLLWKHSVNDILLGLVLVFVSSFVDNINKHNAKLQRADPGTKVTGQFSTRGRIFPHDAQKGFSSFSSF